MAETSRDGTDRRTFLKQAAAAVALGVAGLPNGERVAEASPPSRGAKVDFARRRRHSYQFRKHCAALARDRNRPLTVPVANGEEDDFSGRIANYSKGLPHDSRGVVDPGAYAVLLKATASGHPADFEAI